MLFNLLLLINNWTKDVLLGATIQALIIMSEYSVTFSILGLPVYSHCKTLYDFTYFNNFVFEIQFILLNLKIFIIKHESSFVVVYYVCLSFFCFT